MNYQLNSYVNRKEAEALKEMIFRRARERAQSMTSDVQADVMNIARDSFVSNNNPFSQLINIPPVETQTKEETKSEKQVEEKSAKETAFHKFVNEIEEKSENENVGFPQKNLFTGATTQNKIIKEQISASQIQNNMIEARQGLTNKKSFMGALEFLNSQAAVSLFRTEKGEFRALA